MTDRQYRLLIVEDSQDDLILTKMALKKIGAPVELIHAIDGAQALEMLGIQESATGKSRVRPDLVLLDLKLPKLDGFEVLRSLRQDELTAQIPVVILTTSDDPKDMDQARALNVADYCRKPVRYDHFCNLLEHIIDRWLVRLPGECKCEEQCDG